MIKNQAKIALFIFMVILGSCITIVFAYFFSFIVPVVQAIQCPEDMTLCHATLEQFGNSFAGFCSLFPILVTFMIFAGFLATIYFGYKYSSKPTELGLTFIMAIIAEIFSIYFSNRFQELFQNPTFFSMFTNFPFFVNVILYLPIYTATVFIVALLIGYINFQRVRSSEKGVLDY